MLRLCMVLLCLPQLFIGAQSAPIVVTSDIARFWQAFDAVATTSDSSAQTRLLNELFIAPGTPGLRAMMTRRGYTVEQYRRSILDAPKFWASIRPNSRRAESFALEIEQMAAQLRSLYPALRPARIYFTVGALMSGGTTLDSLLLIGSEIALADSTAVTDELPDGLRENLRRHFDTNPVNAVVLLNAHEYIHTQQGPFGNTLLAVALQEGVAEYVSVLAAKRSSSTPAVAFGEANVRRVRDRFATEMFSNRWNDWISNDFSNEFGVRDVGYYVGYAIAQRYVAQSSDSMRAIATLIELDHRDVSAVEALVDASHYFDKPMRELRADYARSRPTVVSITGLPKGEQLANPGPVQLAITFSAPMSARFRGFDYGPLGEEHVLPITRVLGFSDDRRTLTVEVGLRESWRHQLTITDQFRDDGGRGLVPYVIDVQTRPAP